jgi:hypothetical protein
MKHVRPITANTPQKAAQWQDIVCMIVNTFNALLAAFGTSSPIGDFLGEKCTFPTPQQ